MWFHESGIFLMSGPQNCGICYPRDWKLIYTLKLSLPPGVNHLSEVFLQPLRSLHGLEGFPPMMEMVQLPSHTMGRAEFLDPCSNPELMRGKAGTHPGVVGHWNQLLSVLQGETLRLELCLGLRTQKDLRCGK